MSRRRHLTDEEHALWSGVARSVAPLRRAAAKVDLKHRAKGEAGIEPKDQAKRPVKAPPKTERRETTAPAKSPPLMPLDRRQRQRVARGRDVIDARIDLHGMTQNEAHAALLRFLRRAQADGARIALIVTGKGIGKDAHSGAVTRGVLKRQVPLWLALPEFRPYIVGFEGAHGSHGGEGALYVRLRRAR